MFSLRPKASKITNTAGNGPLPSGWARYAGSCGALPMFTIPVCTAIRFPSCAAKGALFYTRSLLGKQESNRDQVGPTSQAPRLVQSPCACHRGTDRFFRNPLGSLRLHAIIGHYG